MFTVISLLLSTMLIVCYCMAVHTAFTGEEIGSFSWYSYNSFLNQNMLRVKIFTILVLILGCLEFLLCVVSIGYFVYSYRRDYGKVSAEMAFKSMVEIETPITDVYITWKCTSRFTTRPIGFEVAGYLRRNDSVFAKDSSATSGMQKKFKLFVRLWPSSESSLIITRSLSILIFFCINTSININTYLKCFDHSLVEFGNFLWLSNFFVCIGDTFF